MNEIIEETRGEWFCTLGGVDRTFPQSVLQHTGVSMDRTFPQSVLQHTGVSMDRTSSSIGFAAHWCEYGRLSPRGFAEHW